MFFRSDITGVAKVRAIATLNSREHLRHQGASFLYRTGALKGTALRIERRDGVGRERILREEQKKKIYS